MNVVEEDRLHFLDGVRGWAAVSVLLFHLFYETFGVLYPVYQSSYLYPVMDGKLAVIVFFILSGHALSVSFLKKKNNQSLLKLAIKRYPRLAIPSFFSCAIVFVLMVSGWIYNAEAGAIVGRESWLGGWLAFEPRTSDFLRDVFLDTFFVNGESSYNKFLWTMYYEFLGSFLVFITVYVCSFIKRPLWLLIPLALVLVHLSPYFSCFFFGIISAYLHVSGFFEYLKRLPIWKLCTYAGLPCTIFYIIAAHDLFGIHTKLTVVAGVAIMLLVQTNDFYKSAMETRLSKFLGKISFPLYLVHFPIMVSVMSWLIVRANEDGSVSFVETILIGGSVTLVCILAAVAFVPVERFTTYISSNFARLFIK